MLLYIYQLKQHNFPEDLDFQHLT